MSALDDGSSHFYRTIADDLIEDRLVCPPSASQPPSSLCPPLSAPNCMPGKIHPYRFSLFHCSRGVVVLPAGGVGGVHDSSTCSSTLQPHASAHTMPLLEWPASGYHTYLIVCRLPRYIIRSRENRKSQNGFWRGNPHHPLLP